jgi:hypothetical protein
MGRREARARQRGGGGKRRVKEDGERVEDKEVKRKEEEGREREEIEEVKPGGKRRR